MNHEHTTTPQGFDEGLAGELEPLLPPPEGAPVWNDHDRLPRDGAWLYTTAPNTHERHPLTGSWVPADLDAHQVAMVVRSAVGQPVARADLIVIDQIGIETMVDEDHFVPERFRS